MFQTSLLLGFSPRTILLVYLYDDNFKHMDSNLKLFIRQRWTIQSISLSWIIAMNKNASRSVTTIYLNLSISFLSDALFQDRIINQTDHNLSFTLSFVSPVLVSSKHLGNIMVPVFFVTDTTASAVAIAEQLIDWRLWPSMIGILLGAVLGMGAGDVKWYMSEFLVLTLFLPLPSALSLRVNPLTIDRFYV